MEIAEKELTKTEYTIRRNIHREDLIWKYKLCWPRDAKDAVDQDYALRIILKNNIFYGAEHLLPLNDFLKEIAGMIDE